jgi:hypothetical protein
MGNGLSGDNKKIDLKNKTQIEKSENNNNNNIKEKIEKNKEYLKIYQNDIYKLFFLIDKTGDQKIDFKEFSIFICALNSLELHKRNFIFKNEISISDKTILNDLVNKITIWLLEKNVSNKGFEK